MACSQTRLLAGKPWPLYQTPEVGLCCYKVVVESKDEAQEVIEDARAQPDYERTSDLYDIPHNRIQFYVYFTKP